MAFKKGKYFFTIVRGKFLILLPVLCILLACNEQNNRVNQMQATIDSLQDKLNKTYRPGLGEFMTGIQVHHAKLWFAGQNQNWSLADFEIHEIGESLDDINEFCKIGEPIKLAGICY